MLLHPTPEEDKMAFYHPTSSNQGDILPTPYIWESKHASHHELPLLPGNMMMHLNQASSSGTYLEFLSGSSMSSHSCVDVPSLDGANEVVYTTPTSEGRSLQSIIGHINNATGNPITNSAQGDAMMVSRTQLGIMDGGQNSQRQGLSLSLCTQTTSAVPALSSQHQYSNLGITSFSSNHFPMSEEGTISLKGDHSSQNKELRNVEYLSFEFPENNHDVFKTEALLSRQCSVNPNRTHSDPYPSDKSGLENSRYLKAAQQLLDEIVNVRMAWKKPDKYQNVHGTDRDVSTETDGGYGSFSNNGLSSVQHDTISSDDLSPAERQDLQKKKTQLLSMLDEVDKRYKQYYHQMEIIISSFDFIAGSGSAKRYTELARRTISCHFRCLRDSITCQIQATQRSLGEQETIPIQGGIPRLRYVDHHLKQQRSIQQLGVMRHSWRPQRGLPESSVSILRAWLFEHFLNPYPKDSEKIMLARQTGLTRSQVANWFINARVRLWKPMVEEMHKEEFGDSDVNSCSFPENASKAPKDNTLTPEDTGVELQGSLTSMAAGSGHTGLINESKFDVMPHVEINGPTVRVGSQHCPHRDDTSEFGVMTSKDNKRSNVELCSLYLDEFASVDQNGDRSIAAAAYRMSELGDFTVDSQVSLALELRHHEADVLTMCDGNRNRSDDVEASSPGPDMVDYHFTDPGNQRHKLDKPLWTHDFVV